MPRDVFKVSGSDLIKFEENDTFRNLKEAIGFLLGKAPKNDKDLKQFKNDLLRSTIKIEGETGKIIYDIASAHATEKEHQRVMGQYIKFSENQEIKEKKLANLHQGSIPGAYQFLFDNYKFEFANPPYMYLWDDAGKELNMTRKGDEFSYEVKISAYQFGDNEGVQWRIDPKGNFQKILEFDKTVQQLKAEGYKPIFELSVIAKIDLINVPPKEPIASYQVSIESDRSEFKYTGPLVSEEIVSLGNISSADKKSSAGILKTKSASGAKLAEIEVNLKAAHLMLKEKHEDPEKNKRIFIEDLPADENHHLGLKVTIQKESGGETLLQHYQNKSNEVESTLSSRPDYQAIAILFELNDKFFPLRMDTCDDEEALLKIFKAAKFSGRKIEFSKEDEEKLKTLLPDYEKIKNYTRKEFRSYLTREDQEDLKTLEKYFKHQVRFNIPAEDSSSSKGMRFSKKVDAPPPDEGKGENIGEDSKEKIKRNDF